MVIESILLYADPELEEGEFPYRPIALKVCSASRTLSDAETSTIVAISPLDLVDETHYLYERRRTNSDDVTVDFRKAREKLYSGWE